MKQPRTEREWEIEQAADTLIRAAEIRADKKLYAAAKKRLNAKLKALQDAKKRIGA